MHRLSKVGSGGVGGGAPARPGPARSPPPCSGGWLAGPRWLPRWCFGPSLKFGWALLVVLLECAFSDAYFSVFSDVALQNIHVPKLAENVS
jgi:hypothetical protein